MPTFLTCNPSLSVTAIWLGSLATLILAVLAVRGLKVARDGSLTVGWSSPPPKDEEQRKRWARPRFWLYKLGLPVGLGLYFLASIMQVLALYAPTCGN